MAISRSVPASLLETKCGPPSGPSLQVARGVQNSTLQNTSGLMEVWVNTFAMIRGQSRSGTAILSAELMMFQLGTHMA